MSCIQKILEKKGDAEILPLESRNGFLIEGGGNYKGYDWIVTFTEMGHRCGYVAVAKNEAESWDMEGETVCHGGVTFFENPSHILDALKIKPSCDDIWIGFDCAHYRDNPDIDSFKKYKKYLGDEAGDYVVYRRKNMWLEGTVKNFDFVKNECHGIIDQIINRLTTNDRS